MATIYYDVPRDFDASKLDNPIWAYTPDSLEALPASLLGPEVVALATFQLSEALRHKLLAAGHTVASLSSPSALSTQVGGSHYKSLPIQPAEFITKNHLGFLEGCVIKRLCRYNRPGGKGREDLEKAIHEILLLLELGGA